MTAVSAAQRCSNCEPCLSPTHQSHRTHACPVQTEGLGFLRAGSRHLLSSRGPALETKLRACLQTDDTLRTQYSVAGLLVENLRGSPHPHWRGYLHISSAPGDTLGHTIRRSKLLCQQDYVAPVRRPARHKIAIASLSPAKRLQGGLSELIPGVTQHLQTPLSTPAGVWRPLGPTQHLQTE